MEPRPRAESDDDDYRTEAAPVLALRIELATSHALMSIDIQAGNAADRYPASMQASPGDAEERPQVDRPGLEANLTIRADVRHSRGTGTSYLSRLFDKRPDPVPASAWIVVSAVALMALVGLASSTLYQDGIEAALTQSAAGTALAFCGLFVFEAVKQEHQREMWPEQLEAAAQAVRRELDDLDPQSAVVSGWFNRLEALEERAVAADELEAIDVLQSLRNEILDRAREARGERIPARPPQDAG
jgi:hypothetical protein